MMLRPYSLRLAVLSLLVVASASASAATISWNNPAGGSWHTAANWTPAQVPTAQDDVTIALAGVYTVTISGTAAANTLAVGNATGTQTLAVTSGSLTISTSGTIGTGGELVWSGGTLQGGGPLAIGTDALFEITGTADKFFNANTVNNAGTIRWTDGRIFFQNNAVVNNQAGALFDVQGDDTITSSAIGGTINNGGTLRKSLGTGTTLIVQYITLVNTGAIDVVSGTLTTLSAQLGAGTNVTGTGYLVDGGTVSVTGAATVTGTMGVASGTLGGASTLTVNGTLNWTGGAIAHSGILAVAAGGTLAVSGTGDKFLDTRTIENGGTVAWTGGRIFFQNHGVVNNLAAGLFDIQTDNTMTSSAIGGTLRNAGVIRKSAGSGNTQVVTYVRIENNAGTIDVPSGTLTVENAALNDGTQITGTGYRVNGGVNTVTGTATIVGTATLAAGTINGGGTLNVAGTLEWTGGAMAGAGTTLIPAGGLLRLSGGGDKFLDVRTADSYGTTQWSGAGRLFFQNNALFINRANALFDAQNDAAFTSSAIGGNFQNYGTFRKSAGSAATTIVVYIDVLNDGGTFEALAGSIVIDSDLTLAGTSSFTGTNPTQVTGTIDGTATIAGTRLELLGTLRGTGTLTLTGTMAWNSGAMGTSGGSTVVASGATLNIGGTADKFLDARTIQNHGTTNWTGGRLFFQNSGIFNNNATGLFDIHHDSSFTSSAIGGTFNNYGTFRKSGGTGTTTIVVYVAFNNHGATVDVASGTLVIDSPFGINGGNTFTGAGRLKVTGPLSGTASIDGVFELAGGSITGSGAITVNGTLIWSSGVMSGSGSTEIAGNGTLQITSTADHFIDVRTIRNLGTTIWDGGRVFFQNNAVFENAAGAVFENRHDGTFTSSAIGGRFKNFGTFRKTTATGVTTIVVYVAVTSTDATFDIQSGQLSVDAPLTLGGTTNFTGDGSTLITGTLNGTGTIAGRLRLGSGSNVSGAGAIAVAGTLDWEAGVMSTGTGSTTIAAGGVLNIAGTADHFLDARKVYNSGTVKWLGGRVFFQNNAVFTNEAGGVFSAQVDSNFTSSAIGGDFNNAGAFVKATPGTIVMTYVDFINSGVLDVQSGTLRFEKSFQQTGGTTVVNGRIESTTAVSIHDGVLAGGGTFNANVTNSGQVRPGTSPGTLTIQGNYTQTASGVLTIEIVSAASYDRLAISGTFTANGTLDVVSPYSPAGNETFQIITFGSRSGDFATKAGLNLGGGKSYTPAYGPNDLTLTAVNDSANLYVEQTDSPDPVNAGDPLTYTVTVTNGAFTTATGVTLTDTLPAGLSATSVTPSQGSCSGTTTITCTIGTLASQGSATVTIVVTPSTPGTITNSVSVTQNEADPNPGNNSAVESTLVNSIPVATDDSASTTEGTPVTIDVLANDSDADHDPLVIATFSQPSNGSVSCQGSTCTYTPAAQFSGTDTFTYTVSDPHNATDSATVTITVGAQNDPPNAAADTLNTSEDTPASVNVLANDSDPDGSQTGLSVTGNTNGAKGSVTCTAAGNCTYSPAPNANGSDSFTYTVSDPQNATATGTVTVTIAAVNDPPVANDDSLSVVANTSGMVNVLTNDGDPDLDALHVASATNGTKGTASCAANGDCTYTPHANASGADSFTYVVSDNNGGTDGGTVHVTITTGNQPPVANPDSASTAEETPVTIDVLANDSDPEQGPIAIAGNTDPAHGSVTCGTSCTYTPEANFHGTDTFTYTARDAAGATSTTTVTVTVAPVNDPPVANPDSATTDGTVSVEVLANDTDPDGDPLTIVSHSEAANGQVSCRSTRCTYWANAGFTGTDRFSYTITDGSNFTSRASVTITVARTICPPAAEPLEPQPGAGAPSSGTLRWSSTAADTYNVYLGAAGSGCSTFHARVTGTSAAYANLPPGTYEWRVESIVTGCARIFSSCSTFTVAAPCDVLAPPPVASVVARATSGQTYEVAWTAVPNATEYEVQEATNAQFNGATSTRVAATSLSFTRTTVLAPQPFYYRVRAITSCGTSRFSETVRVVIIPPPLSGERNPQISVPAGSTELVVQQLFIPGQPEGLRFYSVTTDKPWLTVRPATGVLPPEGVTVELLADPKNLPNGTVTGTVVVSITVPPSLGSVQTHATTTVNIPVSINLVTPVIPVTAPDVPIPSSLIIPSVGHLGGAASQWQSDVRITNTAGVAVKYQLTFMPSVSGAVKKTVIDVGAGTTTALDDIVRNWFGFGSLGDAAIGFLEIRPLSSTNALTVASSRTYNLTPNGTLGQFIPGIPFRSFVGRLANAAAPVLSLQQIAESPAYRTNVGLVEASGKAASLLLTVFNAAGTALKEIPVALQPNELKQLNGLLAANGITLDDGRIEVRVAAGDGKVTAYASTIDNRTNDPLLVPAVELNQQTASRYILPGAADLDTGSAIWRTDMRVFNSAAEPQVASVVFYPEGGEPVERSIVVAPGEVKVLDSIVREVFGQQGRGGAIHVATATPSSLIVTGRTYNQTAAGTYGLFVPAVTPAEAAGADGRTLHIPQVEDSSRYRTNVGIAEVTGQPATVEVSVVLPDSKATPTIELTLAGNEFRQMVGLLRSMGLTNTYNARVTVRVIGGAGKVTAYGSIIDAETHDPTYVPAQ